MIHTLFIFHTLLGETFERKIYCGSLFAAQFDEWGFYPKNVIIPDGVGKGHYQMTEDLDGVAHYTEVIGVVMNPGI